MKPTLTFEKMEILGNSLGEDSPLPDLIGEYNIQNRDAFELDEYQEIYESYGMVRSAYPYTQFNGYNRTMQKMIYQAAVLENDALRAVFLPELGGRLWQLYDKQNERDILYTNDVLRFSNLATRNAWFSGGVEWNLGVIGHSPFTTDKLYTARLEKEDGTPILRMYEYERIRQVEYQMDFWLEEKGRTLNCRMRILNSGKEVVPMYWWSNMAVPEHKGGRIVVPAKEAFAYVNGAIGKVTIPMREGNDISWYENIPSAADHFFDLKEGAPRYIANLDAEGYGLLHISSARLQSRKLFSWGHTENSDMWQRYLTENAGPYIEIQAGLGKTQYGCIPMAPNTAWEWTEQYEAVKIGPNLVQQPYEVLEESFTDYVKLRCEDEGQIQLEERPWFTKAASSVVMTGNGYGRLKNYLRSQTAERPLSSHLEYSGENPAVDFWLRYLEEGKLPMMPAKEKPVDYICDRELFEKLSESVQGPDKNNWYAYYQLGVYYIWKEVYEKAEELLIKSIKLEETAWGCHALASLYTLTGTKSLSNLYMRRGLELRNGDLSYLKEGFRLLAWGGEYEGIIKCFETLEEGLRRDKRLLYQYTDALHMAGMDKEAYEILTTEKDFVLYDLREGGGNPFANLYKSVMTKLFGECGEIPEKYNFA